MLRELVIVIDAENTTCISKNSGPCEWLRHRINESKGCALFQVELKVLQKKDGTVSVRRCRSCREAEKLLEGSI